VIRRTTSSGNATLSSFIVILICSVNIFVAVTILLAMSVYQIIVSDKLPSTSQSVPVIGR